MPPKQKPGKSRQTYETPQELIDAVEHRFGVIGHDLAASKNNSVADEYFDLKADALAKSTSWLLPGVDVAWCNPPFGRIKPWAAKCCEVRDLQRWTLLLVPMGSQDWACEYVWGKALVLKLKGRVTFVGEAQGFIKDLIVAAYGFGVSGEQIWDWRNEVPGAAE
jgi:phage N-6-adenine-methyltransferase